MSYTYWNIKKQDIISVKKLSSCLGCSRIVSRLLYNRGITDLQQAQKFLNPECCNSYDPFVLSDMDRAVQRIISAINNREKICIYGDYDVDGITSVSVLYLYLKNFTSMLEYYIPDRFTQGYGMNEDAIKTIKERGCSLIITVDTGISAFDEACAAKMLGIDMIITDHHECQAQLPDVFAVVNPKRQDSNYPFKFLAGVGVVYKLICALDIRLETNFCDDNIDLVAVGTIADIMPLLDENRKIVANGLEKLSLNPNLGLKMLTKLCAGSAAVTSANVGYALAPRINAAGRMENAQTAVGLFVTEKEQESAAIAEYLCDLNLQRQQIENKIYNEAEQIIKQHDLNNKYSVLVLWKEGWHNGVIGIVASKLKEKYNKPVVLFSVDNKSKGSARSIAPFNIFEAFKSMTDILIQYGGHKYAAGVLIENSNLYTFRDRLCSYFEQCDEKGTDVCKIDVECEITPDMINIDTAEDISVLQPFGKLNEVPLFCIRNIKISGVFPTSNNRHLRLKLNIADRNITAFYFGVCCENFDYREGDIVDIIFELSENEYKNIKNVQLIVHDLRLGKNQLESFASRRLICDTSDDIIPSMLPSRNDIAVVYKYLRRRYLDGKKQFNIDNIANIICKDCLLKLNYEKVYFSIKILDDLDIISVDISDDTVTVKSVSDGKKVSLCDSGLLMSVYEKAGVEFGN